MLLIKTLTKVLGGGTVICFEIEAPGWPWTQRQTDLYLISAGIRSIRKFLTVENRIVLTRIIVTRHFLMPNNTKYFSTLLEFSHEFRETPKEKGQPGTVVHALIPALGKLKIRRHHSHRENAKFSSYSGDNT